MAVQMITLFCKDIPKMSKGELEAELRAQKWLRRIIEKAHSKLLVEQERNKYSWIRDNKIEFCELYMTNIDGLIEQIEYYIPRRAYETDRVLKTEEDRIASYRRKKKNDYDWNMRDRMSKEARREGINLQWDKEKFLLVARDRGYQTEEALIYAVKNELGLNYERARIMVDRGRFTWGQALCIGAMLEMTPREFCDVFMSGYFVEYMGEYYASYENIDKSALMKRAILPAADTEKSD